MKLTAKLAKSQLKVNRSRTFWTIVGIVLSTALITTVCSFGASGYSLVTEFLGSDFGEYGATLTSLFLIPIIILSVIIVSMSIVVISNSFNASAGERESQFGILKSVGATKEQISSTVMYESFYLSIIGIPIGIALGLLLTFISVGIANQFLGELNSLIHMMMYELSVELKFVLSWIAIAISTLVSLFTVLVSAWIPARKASRRTAIESIRKIGEVKVKKKDTKVSPIISKVFGFEGVLAAKSMKRNKRNMRGSIISITIGIILFINLSSISNQANMMEKAMFPEMDTTVMVNYMSNQEVVDLEITGKEEVRTVAPINSEFAEIVTKRLREYGDVEILGIGMDLNTYNVHMPNDIISDGLKAERGIVEGEDGEFSAEIITVDHENYERICKEAGVPIGSNILINHYSYNDNGVLVEMEPFKISSGIVELTKADGSNIEVKVDGVVKKEDLPAEFDGLNVGTFRLIVPSGDMRGYTWNANPKDIDGFIDYANQVMEEVYPQSQTGSYMEKGFDTSVFMMKDYIKVMNIAIVFASIFIYSFAALFTLIGFTSVISTMSTNVQMRAREFAVLQSIGITYDGLKRMMDLEGILTSIKALTIGLPIAIVLTYLVNIPIKKTYPIPYEFPLGATIACVIMVFAMTIFTMRHSLKKLKGNNIMETIKSV